METILHYITLYAPIILALAGEVGVIATMLTKVQNFFTKTDKAVSELKESNEYKQLKAKIDVVIEENIILKKQLDKLLELMTHVKVKNEEKSNTKI